MEFVNRKRFRDDESSEIDLVHVKKLRESLLDILSDSDPDPTNLNLDLASVMKSFEEEISCGTVSPVDLTSDSGESRPELGYLLEASDDDLGLPPTTEFVESNGIGELRGFEDEIPSFDSLEFGEDDRDYGEFVALDGLFDYSDEVFVGSSNFPWRSDTLPAL